MPAPVLSGPQYLREGLKLVLSPGLRLFVRGHDDVLQQVAVVGNDYYSLLGSFKPFYEGFFGHVIHVVGRLVDKC